MAGDRSDKHGTPMKSTPTPTSGKKTHKRKRDLDGSAVASSTPTKKSKQDQNDSSTPVPAREKKRKEKRTDQASLDKGKKESGKEERAVSPSNEKTKSSPKQKKISKRKSTDDRDGHEEPAGLLEGSNTPKSSKKVKDKESGKARKQKQSQVSTLDGEEENDSKRTKNKYAGILSKFERSAKVKEAAAEKGIEEDKAGEADLNTAEPVVAKGLEPIPQPEPVPEEDVKPTYSSLPPWLANPLRTSAETRTKFSNLGIEPKLLSVLERNGYKEAFAVQSAVIPLLLKGPRNHFGDLCVSAATGSGKTLSYVLPLVTELEQAQAPRLRGLIVVPTRELVKQAREACEFCTAGSGLRVGSAVGNVAIKDEQKSLMRVDQVYSPESVKSRQQAELTGDDWTEFSLQDYVSSATDLGEALPGYVHKVEPNVDILICTPGRLVDHIRYTKGFTLKHLQWLVIDEADRLLNESFQEWVDVVMTSLDSRTAPGAFGRSGEFLSDIGHPLQTKEPRKVILSATMTRDISKLNSLRLTNPRLVVVGTAEETTAEEDGANIRPDEKFTLPTTLKEHSIAVGDGSQKPLYLLRLLLDEIKIDVPSLPKRAKSGTTKREESTSEETSSDDTSSDDTSSDETSSDETSSDSSPESDSDSDSDSDSSDSSSSSSEASNSSDSFDSASASEGEEPESTTPSTQASQRTTVLVFTKSSESASRLSRLLSLLNPSLSALIGTIIKSNNSSASRKTLTAYRRGKLSIIIATDRASRGLDLPSLTHVVNYDVPASITTYVHRVGRTARAGKEGSAWTLVAHREGRWFTNEIARGADGKITRASKVERVAMKLENMKDVKSRYAAALDVLEKEVNTGGSKKGAARSKSS